jgi:predicted nucleotidyltransferase
MAYTWVVTPQKVQTAVHKIVEVSQPQKVILFGSYASGDMGINSDLDVPKK